VYYFFFFSSRRRHTSSDRDWSSDVCSSDLRGFRASGPFLFCRLEIQLAGDRCIQLRAPKCGRRDDAELLQPAAEYLYRGIAPLLAAAFSELRLREKFRWRILHFSARDRSKETKQRDIFRASTAQVCAATERNVSWQYPSSK